ncbi:MAG TPA: hypothetical protein VKV96_14115, partial [Roseiarcus sp.]|nr:hypothetical protein [Roseiarcus sp.]
KHMRPKDHRREIVLAAPTPESRAETERRVNKILRSIIAAERFAGRAIIGAPIVPALPQPEQRSAP